MHGGIKIAEFKKKKIIPLYSVYWLYLGGVNAFFVKSYAYFNINCYAIGLRIFFHRY